MDTNRCHRASRCALEARRTAIAVPDELQENVGLGTNRALRAVRGRSVAGRWPSCQSSREPICPGVLSGGVGGARWTQIDAIARANVPWKPVEWRLPCQMNCRKYPILDFVPKLIQGRHYPAFRMFLPKHILFSYAYILFPMILHIKEGDFQVFLLFCSLFFLYLEATLRVGAHPVSASRKIFGKS